MDVHQATISIAVLDSAGKLVMLCTIETKAETILQFFDGLRGTGMSPLKKRPLPPLDELRLPPNCDYGDLRLTQEGRRGWRAYRFVQR